MGKALKAKEIISLLTSSERKIHTLKDKRETLYSEAFLDEVLKINTRMNRWLMWDMLLIDVLVYLIVSQWSKSDDFWIVVSIIVSVSIFVYVIFAGISYIAIKKAYQRV